MSLEQAAAAKTLSTNGFRKVTALFETTKHNITRQIKATLPPDAQNIMVEFASAGGAASTGAHPTGGSSAGAGAGKWIEDFPLSDSLAGQTLYIQIGRGGLPTPAGTYTFTAANNAGNTFINLLDYSQNLPNLLLLYGGNVFGTGAAPTATRGQATAVLTDGNNITINGVQPADASAGVQGTTMSMFPARTVAYQAATYPPIDSVYKSPYGNYGTTPGSGAGISGGVGLTGGSMGAFDYPNNVGYNVGSNTGQGANASGGYASFGLRQDKYSAMINLDVYGAVTPFKRPTFGTDIGVDTQNQELWGAGGVGAATGHMGSYGGDGVLCISFWTAQKNIDPIWNNTISLVDTTTNASGLAVPNTWFGIHSLVTAAEVANGKRINGVVGAASSGTVSIVSGIPTFACANGHGLYNVRKGMRVIFVGLGAGGTDFETRLISSNYFGSLTTGPAATAVLQDTPPSVGATSMKIKAYIPPFNYGIVRSHDSGGCSDWARADLGLANGTLVSGDITITGITLVNRFDFSHPIASQAITAGMAIVGTGIPANTTITAVAGSTQGAFTITMSNPASASGAVAAKIYNKVGMDEWLNSPMMVGKKLMFMMSGCPEWLASSAVAATTRTVSGNNVTINHAALPFALQVGMPLTVRNSAKTAINGRDPINNANFKVTASTTISTTYTTPTATGNETAVADTTVELIPWSNEQTFGYAMPPNPAVGGGFAEVNNFVTWLMTNYGSMISHLDGWNEANTGWRHGGVFRQSFDNAQSSFYLGNAVQLGEVVRRTNQAAKAIAPTVKIGTPSITGIDYSQQFYISDADATSSRSSAHRLLAAGDGIGGKMVDWCDYCSAHMYSTSANWMLNTRPHENIVTWLKFINRLLRMESINKPNMPIVMTEGGHEAGSSRNKLIAMSDTERSNEIFKWFSLQMAFNVQGVFPFIAGFMGDPECNPVDEAAYTKVGLRLAGKTIHPDASFNKFTAAMRFKTTDGYEEYIP